MHKPFQRLSKLLRARIGGWIAASMAMEGVDKSNVSPWRQRVFVHPETTSGVSQHLVFDCRRDADLGLGK